MNIIGEIPCPIIPGHKGFIKELSTIKIGKVETAAELCHFIRPFTCTQGNETDGEIGLEFLPGELQKADLQKALAIFHYPDFISRTFEANRELFKVSQCRIYQFQKSQPKGLFVYGLIITDGSNNTIHQNLIDFCLERHLQHKRRAVIIPFIKQLCTPESVMRRLGLN